ncbi:MAG TPA: RNA polymerase sigma-70 factor [Hanamia sp.]|nr:RNA polymerase sigma-70 factor [Hanamia sp.]
MVDCSRYDEKVLLAEIATGDERAFRKLFDLYKERFYAVVLKMTNSDEVAQDIVQDIFMNIWGKRESLVDIENPSSYFFTAVYRKVYHHYRKIALEKKLLQIAPSVNEAVNTTDEIVLAHESENLISQAIAKLPPQQQLVFKLSKQEGLSREKIAHQLHISPNTVKNHLADAIKFIRVILRNSTFGFLIIFWFFKK